MFKHAGTSENKALIEICIHYLNINITVPNCEVVVVFQRGDRKAQTTPVYLVNKYASIEQTLKIPATLYYDIKLKEYQKKLGSLFVLIKYEKGLKNAGQIEIDFANYLNQRKGKVDEISPLGKCPDPNAVLSYTINFLSQDQRSKTPEANINNIREDQSKTQLQILDNQNKQLKQEIVKLQEQIETLQNQNKQQQQQIQQLQNNQVQETPTALPQDCKQCYEHELELESLKKQIKNLKKLQVTEKCEKCNELQLCIEQLKKKTTQNQQFDDQNNQIELLTNENTNLKERLFDFEKLITKIKKENQELKNKISVLNQQLQEFKSRIEQLECDDENDRRIEEYQQLIQNLNDEKIAAESKIISFSMEYEQLKRERDEYESQLQKISKLYDLLEFQLFQQKQKYANAMHAFLSMGDTNAIEVLEKFSND